MSGLTLHRRALVVGGIVLAAPTGARAATDAIDVPALVETLARLVEREYPDPEIGRAVAARLKAKLRAGAYGDLDHTALAAVLTADMRAAGRDEHFQVHFKPDEAAMRASADDPPVSEPPKPTPREPSARARAIFAPQAYGVTRAEIMPGNIGLLQVDNFVPLYEVTRGRFGNAFALLADTYGLVIDLRGNSGGMAESAAHLVSYLFDRESFLLDRLVWRRQPAEESRTSRDLAGPNYGERRPVFVCTGRRTFSAAEAVAYDVQAFKRGLTVGVKSRGGANPGDFFNLGQGFQAFTPQGRAINAATGTNWEGVGVIPDVPADKDRAVEVAWRQAIEAALAQTSDQTAIEVLREGLST